MPQISSLSFNVTFEAHNPNRVGLSNTTPSLPAGFVGIFKVTQPDGYVRNGDIDNPDVTNLVSSCYVTLVPDSAGQLQQGQYTIEFIGNAPGYLSTSFIRTFTLQYTAASISLRNDFDVFTPHLAYTDISNYNVSGYTIASGPTRNWTATSATTGAITSTNSSIDIKKNNQYYAETYVIQFGVTVSYLSQAYPWLTLSHTRSQSTTVTACIPKSLEDLTQLIEALREESNASCGGDWARFEKANSLYVHLINMLRLVLIAGQHQDGFFDVYQQLLSYLQNGSVACDSIGQVIPPYDFSDYESSIYDGQASYCQLVGDGVNTVYRVNHQLGDECVVVQVYEVATGKQVFCDLAVSTINSIDITFYEPPTLNQYRVVAVAGAIGIRGQGFQPGGLTGQLLRKRTNADFDTEWADVTVALPYLVPYTGATQSVYLGEYGVEAGFVRFDTTPTATPAVPAVMSWNDADGTVDLKLKGNNVSLQVGQEMVARVVNKTGANLLESQYKAVRIRKVSEGGAQGQRLAVVLAQANTEFASTDMLGIVTENITNNQEGFITTFGTVRGIDTTGALQGETWADGDILFLSPTVPGGLTKVKPSAPNHLSIVGYVEYAHQNNGKIFVHVQTSWEIDELHNVSISSPVTNQTLVYNSGTGLWENSKLSLHALSNVFVSSPQPNQALVYTGGGWQNQTLSFVSTVGLATTTPGVTITDTPVTGSGVININIATASASSNGLLSSADWATFNAKQSALTFGNISTATSGVTITNGNASTVGPNVSISIATAASGQNGLLSASDWATFNSKVGGSGTVNYVPKFTAAGTIGNSQIFDEGTNVGIGTTSPGSKLDVRSTGYNIIRSTGGNGGYFDAYNTSGTRLASFGAESGGDVYFGSRGSSPVIAITNNAERLRITSGGNVGINTTSPTHLLTLSQASGGTVISLNNTFNTANNRNWGLQSNYLAYGDFTINQSNALFGDPSAAGTSRLYIQPNGRVGINTTTDAGYQLDINGTLRSVNGANFATTSGSVGIGTASPDQKFTVQHSSASTYNPSSILAGGMIAAFNNVSATANTAATLLFNISGDGAASGISTISGIIDGNGKGVLTFGTRNLSVNSLTLERMRLNADGELLINTTSDAGDYKLQVAGNIYGSGLAKIGDVFTNTNAPFVTGGNIYTNGQSLAIGTQGSNLFGIFTSNTARMYIFSNGRVVINTTTDSGYQFDVNGSVRGQSDAALATGSGNVFVGATTAAISNGVKYVYAEGGSTGIGPELILHNTVAQDTASMAVSFTGVRSGAGVASQIRSTRRGILTFHTQDLPSATPNTPAERMRIDAVGNVGIGLAAPNTRFSVSIPFANNGDVGTLVSGQTGATTVASINTVVESTTTGATAMTFSTLTANSSVSEKVRITNAGNVGIGITDPSSYSAAANRLVVGNLSAQSGITIRTPTNGDGSLFFADGTTGDEAYRGYLQYIHASDALRLGTSGTERMRITSDGNVGIGTAGPLNRLHTEFTSATAYTPSNTLTAPPIAYFYNNSSADAAVASTIRLDAGNLTGNNATSISAVRTGNADSALTFGTRSAGSSVTERVRITSGGDLVVGQTSDGFSGAGRALFGLNGTSSSLISMRYGGTSAGYIVANSSAFEFSSNSSLPLVLSTSGTERMRIFNSGRVFIGASPTDAGYQLDVNGNTRVTGKIDISANDSFGLNIVRPGTSAIAAQIYNNGGANGWMLYGVESSAGGVIFSGTEAYASVIGSYNNYSLQMVTNNAVRMTVTGGGSVGIGVASPSASAVLQVDSTTKGMLPPRMTTTQRDAITSPATGLIVYDTTVNKIGVYNGTSWRYAQYE